MQPPQPILKVFLKRQQYFKAIAFLIVYQFSKIFNNRYLYYTYVFRNIPDHPTYFDLAISYQGPTDIIDYYVADKINATKKASWVHFDVSKHLINEKLYNRLYKRFNKVFVVSTEARNKLIRRIPSVKTKTEVFRNIVSKTQIHQMAKDSATFEEGYEGIRIITVGRLSKEKGQHTAIQVLAMLRDEGYEVRWYCIGDGRKRKEYERMIEKYGLKDDFILMGSRLNPFPFTAQADIYVQTSTDEGYCLALAEAKCLNKPIVTTDFIGAYEQITDGYNGLIVSGKQGLYKGIKKLIDHPEQLRKLSENLSKNELDTTSEVKKLMEYIN